MTICIYGASDDLVEVDGAEGASPEEYNVYSNHPGERALYWAADFAPPGEGEQLRVHAIYDGCWHFSIGQVDEDVKLPRWPIRFEQGDEDWGTGKVGPGYSVVLLIDAPEGTRIVNLWPKPDDA